jgi:hypothetical protein
MEEFCFSISKKRSGQLQIWTSFVGQLFAEDRCLVSWSWDWPGSIGFTFLPAEESSELKPSARTVNLFPM